MFENIIIDDYIPVDEHERVRFTTTPNNCLWPIFLEKASAKVYGAFWHIGGAGAPSRALKDLTGAPNEFYKTKDHTGDELYDKVVDADTKEYIMVAPTHGDASKVQKDMGMIPWHAYTVIGAHTLAGEKVIKMRNPHGKGEWNGDWSDSSNKWTPALKRQVDMKDVEDGTFFMPIAAFMRNFQEIAVCHYRPKYVYTSLKLDAMYMRGIHAFRIGVTTPGDYYVSLSKPDIRFEDVTELTYTTMVLFKKNGDDYEYCGGKLHVERDPFFKANLQSGEYILIVSTFL